MTEQANPKPRHPTHKTSSTSGAGPPPPRPATTLDRAGANATPDHAGNMRGGPLPRVGGPEQLPPATCRNPLSACRTDGKSPRAQYHRESTARERPGLLSGEGSPPPSCRQRETSASPPPHDNNAGPGRAPPRPATPCHPATAEILSKFRTAPPSTNRTKAHRGEGLSRGWEAQNRYRQRNAATPSVHAGPTGKALGPSTTGKALPASGEGSSRGRGAPPCHRQRVANASPPP